MKLRGTPISYKIAHIYSWLRLGNAAEKSKSKSAPPRCPRRYAASAACHCRAFRCCLFCACLAAREAAFLIVLFELAHVSRLYRHLRAALRILAAGGGVRRGRGEELRRHDGGIGGC